MDRNKLKELLSINSTNSIANLHVFSELDSTNAEAGRLLGSGVEGVQLIIANSQSAGRGRRGRIWVSPSGSGLYLSLVYPFSINADALQGLSLITAISTHTAIQDFGARNLQLKWPNDILVGNKKLSGILLESRSENNQTWVVFGIGINFKLTEDQKQSIDRPVTDIEELLPDGPSMEQLAASTTNLLLENIVKFQDSGFSTFQTAWNKHDRYLERDIVIQNGNSQKIGRCQGVDENGALLLQTAEGILKISGGEIFPSLREASE
ncbi:MAG: biotin--[acetyl-CoA-carboxylase] ligase [Pseudomonadales bacterium]|nr:biotin--[acetyl-CoA-carboxylase] ligase [Pseudomonadales bacterium]